VSFKSDKQIVGYGAKQGEPNSLQVKFTPPTRLPPNGKGKILIKVPNWWTVGTKAGYHFPIKEKIQCKTMGGLTVSGS